MPKRLESPRGSYLEQGLASGMCSMLWVEHGQQLPHGCQDKVGEGAEKESLPVLVVRGQCWSFASVGPADKLLNLPQVRWNAIVSV